MFHEKIYDGDQTRRNIIVPKIKLAPLNTNRTSSNTGINSNKLV